MFRIYSDVLADESGASAIEYGLIAGLVSVAAILGMQALGLGLVGMFYRVASGIDSAISVVSN
jgi:pilus assembly protein Flp/PilA